MEDTHESDVAIICRLAHDNLSEVLGTRSEVLCRLPRNFRGSAEELAKTIHSNLDTVPTFRFPSSSLACIHQNILAYQRKREHNKPPSRIERFSAMGCENFHAKRISCELMKAWAEANKDLDDEAVDADEALAFFEFVGRLLLYYDRWTQPKLSIMSQDPFVETFVDVNWKLYALKQATQAPERLYTRTLERIYERSTEFCDAALRVSLLGVCDNHAEFENFVQRNGPITMRRYGQKHTRGTLPWLCSDMGQIVETALTLSDQRHFPAADSTVADVPRSALAGSGTGRNWMLWTHEQGAFKSYDYGDAFSAERSFEMCSCCAVLMGPNGKINEKRWAGAVISLVMNEEQVMRNLNRQAHQHRNMNRAAVGLEVPVRTELMRFAPPVEAPAPAPLPAAERGQSSPAESPRSQTNAANASNLAANAVAGLSFLGSRIASSAETGGSKFLGIVSAIKTAADQHMDKEQELQHRQQQLASSRAPVLQDRVKILVENGDGVPESPARNGTAGLIGTIVEVDEGDVQPYRVDFGDGYGYERWYKEDWVILASDVVEATDAAAAAFSPPDRAQEPERVACEKSPTAASTTSGVSSEANGEATLVPAGAPAAAAVVEAAPAAPVEELPEPLSGRAAWDAELEGISRRWCDNTSMAPGLADNFRGAKKVKWYDDNGRRREDLMPNLILDLPKKLADVVTAHVQVMGAVNNLVSQGGSKEALAVIHALRCRNSIAGQLASAMDRFIDSAGMVNGIIRHELFRSIEKGLRINDQQANMQRMYNDSFAACSKLRDTILNEWHQLTLKISDTSLAQEFQRVNTSGMKAYESLMNLPMMLPALGNAPHSAGGGQVAAGQLMLPAPDESMAGTAGVSLSPGLARAQSAPQALGPSQDKREAEEVKEECAIEEVEDEDEED